MHEGDCLPGFTNIDQFYSLLMPKLEKIREPCLNCLSETYIFLDDYAKSILRKRFKRFPTLIPEMEDVISQLLIRERDKTRSIVQAVIDAEEE